jgi:dTDP-4-amino-4,6-dideoxygalactose transaminase
MINVTKTYLPDRSKYKSYIDRIFDSGWLTNHGQFVLELEKRLKDYLEVDNLIVVTNGTMALQIAYKVLGLKGNVITTPFTFIATVSSLVWEGLKPVFADIDKKTFNIDPDQIERRINKDTSAILPVHVFGNACNIDFIENISRKNNL